MPQYQNIQYHLIIHKPLKLKHKKIEILHLSCNDNFFKYILRNQTFPWGLSDVVSHSLGDRCSEDVSGEFNENQMAPGPTFPMMHLNTAFH